VPTPARELERYRKDYARYILQACDDDDHNGDWRFTLKSHIFDAITMSLGKTEQMARVLHRLLVTNIGVYDWDTHLIDVGRDGLTSAMDTFYGQLFGEVFKCNPDVVKAELGMFNIGKELRYITDRMEEVQEAQVSVLCTQKELVNLCKAQLVESRRQLAILQQRSLTQAPDRFAPSSKYPLRTSPSPDVSFHSFNSNSLYEMSGALRPPSPTLNTDRSASPSELLVEVSASR
jgi:hypothetical protein